MSTQSILVNPSAPHRRQTPTIWRRVGGAISRVGSAIWRALEESGRRRAARELLDMAQRADLYDPALAMQLRIASHFDSMT